jgi:hypothetical protein
MLFISFLVEEKANTHLLLGMCLDACARYLLFSKQSSQAQRMYERALQISQEIQGERHPQVKKENIKQSSEMLCVKCYTHWQQSQQMFLACGAVWSLCTLTSLTFLPSVPWPPTTYLKEDTRFWSVTGSAQNFLSHSLHSRQAFLQGSFNQTPCVSMVSEYSAWCFRVESAEAPLESYKK